MIGTWVNVAGIILGSLIGTAVKKGIPPHINKSIIKAEGLGVTIIALNGVIASMFSADSGSGKLSDSGGLLLLISLVVGCLAGELLRLDDRINSFGARIENRFGVGGFAKGFVSASLIFPIGAMAIIGALNDGLRGDSSVLFMKSTLDFTTSIVLSSALGIGVLFSFIPVLILQGGVSLLAGVISSAMSKQMLDAFLASFSMVGYTLVLAIGLNFITESNIKVANLLPALLIPILYHIVF